MSSNPIVKAINRQRRIDSASTKAANLIIGGAVYAVIALFGAPTWGDLGFALTAYLVVANGTN